MIAITRQTPADAMGVEAVLDQAIGADRRAKPSYRLRSGMGPVAGLSLVARGRGRILGTIRYWPVSLGDINASALLLGPLGVAPDARGLGLGGKLIAQSLDMAEAQGHDIVCLVGDIEYYSRHGFEPGYARGLRMDGAGDRFLVRTLTPGALDGVVGKARRWEPARQPQLLPAAA